MRMVLNETSYFGAGCRKEIKGELARRGYKKAFVVSDRDLVKFGVATLVTDELDEAGVAYVVFDEVKANPTIHNVQTGFGKFKAFAPDVIIAIGGGSVIDTAKAIGIIATNPDFYDVRSLEGVADTKHKAFPIMAFATTSGTAAEVTINYVITDEEAGRKLVCVDPHDIPVVAFNDAEMMISMPKGLTAATGMDALTHAIEGYITKGAHALSDLLCWNSIKMIAENLATATFDGKNAEAREGMAMGSYVAGMAFSNVGLGIVHSMAHPLGARYDIAHGVANALMLEEVMRFNASEKPTKMGTFPQYGYPHTLARYAEVADYLGLGGKTNEEKLERLIKAVNELKARVGIKPTIRDYVSDEKDFLDRLDAMTEQAFDDQCTGANPRYPLMSEIKQMYLNAYYGKHEKV